MDRTATPRKRRPDPPQPTLAPTDMRKDKSGRDEAARRPHSGKIRTAKDSSEIIRVPRKSDASNEKAMSAVEDETNARHFTVANVGTGGTVYLQPSLVPPHAFTQPPATPPRTSERDNALGLWLTERQSNSSENWTPRLRSRYGAVDQKIPVPPLSINNAQARRRPRSHSFSTVSERGRARSPTFDSSDVPVLVNGRDVNARPKSSVDLSGGFLDLHIPHYRLGTPHFSERGTAYLHNSLHSSVAMTEDMGSSVFSRAEFDKLFPAPPGSRPPPASTTSSPYLHPGTAKFSPTPARTPPTPPASTSPPSSRGAHVPVLERVFEKVEANPNDPAIVRYHAITGKIAAATPARLVAQITSPLFLDYELLSDFFLTFRGFLSCRELLEYLMARMKWALGQPTDAGRIVRVRTFVALRHWILNYFSDDFLPVFDLRQRFCDLVNDLARQLQTRSEGGGSDISIIGELKKCWRRTCALFWPVTDALHTSPLADILPGGNSEEDDEPTALPMAMQPKRSKADFRRISASVQVPAPVSHDFDHGPGAERPGTPERGAQLNKRNTRTASIPTSPMSEDSLQVLSCSVPFLKQIRPSEKATQRSAARPAGPQKTPQIPRQQNRPMYSHKRSGSFSDALRDGRAPVPSSAGEAGDALSLQSMTFPGGLVRGLVLQPSPPKLDSLVPVSPAEDPRQGSNGHVDDGYFEERPGQNLGVKRLVGDVRRALSSRKGRTESPVNSHRSTPSSDSRSSANLVQHTNRPPPSSAWQRLRGPDRTDVLGAKIGDLYREAFHDANLPDPTDEDAHRRLDEERTRESRAWVRSPSPPFARPGLERWNSRVTTGDRSILIMDDTGMSNSPIRAGALPSVASTPLASTPVATIGQPPHLRTSGSPDIWKTDSYNASKSSLRRSATFSGIGNLQGWSNDIPLQDLFKPSKSWALDMDSEAGDDVTANTTPKARKSSVVHPADLEMSSAQHRLRRRPGGNLKATEHVHELEPIPRPYSAGSMSTNSRYTSGIASWDLSGSRFSGKDFGSWRLPSGSAPERKHGSTFLLDTHSSQPNLRPSFQAEATQLATLPDRAYAGGIEETLRKLEGTSENMSESTRTSTTGYMPPLTRQDRSQGPLKVTNISVPAAASSSVDGRELLSPRTETQGASIYHLSASEGPEAYGQQSKCSSDAYGHSGYSEAQDSAAPVLPASSKHLKVDSDRANRLRFSDKLVKFAGLPPSQAQAGAERPVTKSDNASKPGTPQGSFLLDDNESLSDISTEIADQAGDDALGVRSFFFDDTVGDDDVLPQTFRAPPTPPSTNGLPADHSPERPKLPQNASMLTGRHVAEAHSAPKLLSPNLDKQHHGHQPLPSADLRRTMTAPGSQAPVHLPFVLAFESETVAEQLTIIEKDALDEIEWKDLIELNWHQSPPTVRDWVKFLKQDDCTGVDIVVARFNLVVKWVISECLLTDAPSERARCITKYIHVAMHCRRLRNYASMYQITLGLLSADLTRLHKTWSLVAAVEREKLAQLKRLCQPLRNFSDLRKEMESSTLDGGCIPFIGIYTHDLMFNAQKPARISPTPPPKEPLVNFERYQTSATIVKSLLRLIEASAKYVFHPHPEVLSRCLWLAALSDAEITALAEQCS
ncbi:hypothetical protein BTJ68_03986 [Hortaea werneckii EXF-2000]|uniref:Ras-GEF domain-containing protein n=1 Tax=Hortaea werneckii EXF-2000 TaxID=1157616 RepID=A0A1Z5TIL0_HORWE|nr:hypothetical protein BTJ68_03986 [Hortaea werneckii EXF-2000]